jgi:hypothetical protein
MKRVKLIKTLNQDEMPVGTTGTIVDGTMDKPGMLIIDWDNGHRIPMYRNELEAI